MPHLRSWSPFVAACLTSGGKDAVSLSFGNEVYGVPHKKVMDGCRNSLGQLTLLVVHQVDRGHQGEGDEQDRKH